VTENKPFWKNYLNPRRIIICAAVLLAALALFFSISYLWEQAKVVPEELLNTSINNTLKSQSYKFHTKSTITLDGEDKVFSDLYGEKASDRIFHVTGSMLGTDIDVYQVENTTYRMDPMTKRWIVIEDNSVLQESLLMAELNPLSNFYFKDLISASYLGKEKVNKRKTYKIQCIPQIKNKWLDNYFKDLNYTIWVDKKDSLIKKAVVNARSKEKETGSLKVEVELWDYGKEIEIKAAVEKNN
jgi:hypothetical protein